MQSTEYCCIATHGEEGVWANPVFFAWDERYNLFFISQMHSQHMQNIVGNTSISVAIYSTQQKGDVAGIQLEGTAHILESKEESEAAAKIYYARASGEDTDHYTHDPSWLFVKITSKHLYYFDTRFFGEERQEVPLSLID